MLLTDNQDNSQLEDMNCMIISGDGMLWMMVPGFYCGGPQPGFYFYVEGGEVDGRLARAVEAIPDVRYASNSLQQDELSDNFWKTTVDEFVRDTPATTQIEDSSGSKCIANDYNDDYVLDGVLDPESERRELALDRMEDAIARCELTLQGMEEWISRDTNQVIHLISSLTTRLDNITAREREVAKREEALVARAKAIEEREVEIGIQLASRERAISYHERGLCPMPNAPHEPDANYCAQFRRYPWSEIFSREA
ncbi:hypothetical protein EYC80_010340 [Monilinia laxa]|uniref:Uncharacterized protein n=1 Tax=Monilinia laxa TaxID=61186 RepID=A0A5N6JR63_MONLA|nr:hypothetical protein EYC80_010340 [Monilinia laxa]